MMNPTKTNIRRTETIPRAMKMIPLFIWPEYRWPRPGKRIDKIVAIPESFLSEGTRVEPKPAL
jgi:hypothetical protein